MHCHQGIFTRDVEKEPLSPSMAVMEDSIEAQTLSHFGHQVFVGHRKGAGEISSGMLANVTMGSKRAEVE